jgi:hypothetical protein
MRVSINTYHAFVIAGARLADLGGILLLLGPLHGLSPCSVN